MSRPTPELSLQMRGAKTVLMGILIDAVCTLFSIVKKIVRRDACLFEDGPERAFWHIPWMVGYGRISVGLFVVPDFVTA